MEGGDVSLLIEEQVEGGCNEDISPLIEEVLAVEAIDGISGGRDEPVVGPTMKTGFSSLPFSGTSTPSLSATGDSNKASIEEKMWSGNADICSEEVSIIMREGVQCRTCLHL